MSCGPCLNSCSLGSIAFLCCIIGALFSMSNLFCLFSLFYFSLLSGAGLRRVSRPVRRPLVRRSKQRPLRLPLRVGGPGPRRVRLFPGLWRVRPSGRPGGVLWPLWQYVRRVRRGRRVVRSKSFSCLSLSPVLCLLGPVVQMRRYYRRSRSRVNVSCLFFFVSCLCPLSGLTDDR